MTTTMTMTMLLTTLYICTCKQNVRKQKQFGRYTGTLPYYLDLPDGQLMIGGKVVGTLGRLDAELIADNKREKKLLGLSVILSPWGRPNQKSGRAEGGNKLILSYNARWYTQTLTDSLTDSHSGLLRQAYLEPSAIVCVCVLLYWLFPTNELIGKKVRSFLLGGMGKVV